MSQEMEVAPQQARGRAINPRLALLVTGVVVLAAVGLAIGLVFAFSGGGGETTADPELSAYLNDTAALINDIDNQTGEANVAAAYEAFIVFASVLQDTSAQINGLVPPAELAQAHTEMVESLNDGGSRMLELSDQHRAIGTVSEVREVVNADEEITAANDRLVAACQQMRLLAVEREIEVEFEIC